MNYFNNDWKEVLKSITSSDYFQNLIKSLQDERKSYRIYPEETEVFRAFKLTSYKDVKVVIIGQDPYHSRGVADGLAFSTKRDARIPPSLKNIFTELEDDLGIKNSIPDLSSWAKQGVLLLNESLSVREGQALSHAFLNWNKFTSFVLSKLSERKDPIIFVLWGKKAQAFEPLITSSHYIIKSPHPSPLSAYRGFFGSRVFSKINNTLIELGYKPIDFKTR